MSRYIDADAMKEWIDEYVSVFKKADRKTESQTEYDKYREKIRPHDPHKDW